MLLSFAHSIVDCGYDFINFNLLKYNWKLANLLKILLNKTYSLNKFYI